MASQKHVPRARAPAQPQPQPQPRRLQVLVVYHAATCADSTLCRVPDCEHTKETLRSQDEKLEAAVVLLMLAGAAHPIERIR